METLLKAKTKVMVTGACGFIGSALVKMLANSGYQVIGVGRRPPPNELEKYFSNFICCDLTQIKINADFLLGSDSVINLAGLAHNPRIAQKDIELAYQETNALLPEKLARAASDAGASKFIHLSSVKAIAENSPKGLPFDETAPTPNPPTSVYGHSKWDGETRLIAALKNSKTQHVILRPPLIYGPNAKGTLFELIRLIDRKVPLPLKCSEAKRSLISNTNLCTAIFKCLDHRNRASGAFFVSDGVSVHVPDLIEMIGLNLGFKPLIFPVPKSLMRFVMGIARKTDFYDKLFLDLEVKSDEFCRQFSWTPNQSLNQGVKEMVNWYKKELTN